MMFRLVHEYPGDEELQRIAGISPGLPTSQAEIQGAYDFAVKLDVRPARCQPEDVRQGEPGRRLDGLGERGGVHRERPDRGDKDAVHGANRPRQPEVSGGAARR